MAFLLTQAAIVLGTAACLAAASRLLEGPFVPQQPVQRLDSLVMSAEPSLLSGGGASVAPAFSTNT